MASRLYPRDTNWPVVTSPCCVAPSRQIFLMNTRLFQAVIDRVMREPAIVFLARKTFFLGGCDDFSVNY